MLFRSPWAKTPPQAQAKLFGMIAFGIQENQGDGEIACGMGSGGGVGALAPTFWQAIACEIITQLHIL